MENHVGLITKTSDKVKVRVGGKESQQTEMKQKGKENKNSMLLSVILCICLTQQSGGESLFFFFL